MRTQQIGKQKQRRFAAGMPQKPHFRARKAAPFLFRGFLSRRGQKGERRLFCCPIHRIRGSTSTMIRVHCPAFTSRISRFRGTKRPCRAFCSIFFFIIAPQKNTVNPKPWIYRNFIKQNTPSGIAAYRKGRFVWILPWCEEESCYSGKRLRPHFPWQKYNSFHNSFR